MEEETKQADEMVEKMNMVCFWLINMCMSTNAEEMKINQKNVTVKGVEKGDWEIIVRKKK